MPLRFTRIVRIRSRGPAIFRFIHAADIHLDSPLRGLERYEGAPVEQIRTAARGALSNLVNLAIDQQVDFVLIAGDLYDGNWKSSDTGFFFTTEAARLREAAIPLYLISGNHDAQNRMTRSLRLPDNVTMFSAKEPQTVTLPELDVAIHGQSFATAAVTEDLSESYPPAVDGHFNIGMLHTCGSGGTVASADHARYAPCTVEGLKQKGYDYWALGHVHNRQMLATDPVIAFPGNIQGRHARETGAKGCLLVTVDDHRHVETEFQALDTIRWERSEVDVTDVATTDSLLESIASELRSQHQASDDRALAIRMTLTGTTRLHRELQSQQEHWTDEVRALGIDVGRGDLWIEKVILQTQAPDDATMEPSLSEGAIGELRSIFDQAKRDPAKLSEIQFDLSDAAKKLPTELRSLIDTDDPQWVATVLEQSEALLLSRLMN